MRTEQRPQTQTITVPSRLVQPSVRPLATTPQTNGSTKPSRESNNRNERDRTSSTPAQPKGHDGWGGWGGQRGGNDVAKREGGNERIASRGDLGRDDNKATGRDGAESRSRQGGDTHRDRREGNGTHENFSRDGNKFSNAPSGRDDKRQDRDNRNSYGAALNAPRDYRGSPEAGKNERDSNKRGDDSGRGNNQQRGNNYSPALDSQRGYGNPGPQQLDRTGSIQPGPRDGNQPAVAPRGQDSMRGGQDNRNNINRDDRSGRTNDAPRDRVEKIDRPERVDRAVKIDRVERIDRAVKIDRPERIERVERIERPAGNDQRARVERIDRPDNSAKDAARDRAEKQEKVDRSERTGGGRSRKRS